MDLAFVSVTSAFAHSHLVVASPTADSIVDKSPTELDLKYKTQPRQCFIEYRWFSNRLPILPSFDDGAFEILVSLVHYISGERTYLRF